MGDTMKRLLPRGLLRSEELYQYLLDTSVYPRESEFLKEPREASASHPRAPMATDPDAGQLVEMLLKIINAKRTIEIGVFTGYSLLLTALSIPEDGKILAIDVDREAFNLGLPIIKKAGQDHKINFVESEALPVLDKLLENINYWNYHERLMRLLRVGGIAAYDNTLWGGTVAMPEESIPAKKKSILPSILEFNKKIATDPRIQICHAPLGDGITICRRIC